jgi:hypothetical protein
LARGRSIAIRPRECSLARVAAAATGALESLASHGLHRQSSLPPKTPAPDDAPEFGQRFNPSRAMHSRVRALTYSDDATARHQADSFGSGESTGGQPEGDGSHWRRYFSGWILWDANDSRPRGKEFVEICAAGLEGANRRVYTYVHVIGTTNGRVSFIRHSEFELRHSPRPPLGGRGVVFDN